MLIILCFNYVMLISQIMLISSNLKTSAYEFLFNDENVMRQSYIHIPLNWLKFLLIQIIVIVINIQ